MGNALRLGISRIGLAWTKWRMRTKIKKKIISLLILGLQESGKTTIALRLWKYKRTLPDLNYVQTKGFNTFTIQRKNKSTINLYDLGGHSSIQELWDHYYADSHGVIFVVDVSDREKIPEAGEIFSKVLNDHRIRGKPVLLLANKQDLHGTSETELDGAMNLQEVVNSVRCLTRLDESTATDLKNSKGIFEGFRWLVSYIENHYLELNERVMHDTLEEKNREKARRALVKEQMDGNQSRNNVERPQSQKSNRSVGLVGRRESCEVKDGIAMHNVDVSDPPPSRDPIATNPIATNPLKLDGDEQANTTNYLIKSRPTSSSGDPFLISRKISAAPSAHGNRRSLPDIHEKKVATKSIVAGEKDSLLNNTSAMDTLTGAGMTGPAISPSVVVSGRLSPEGADSDEGIVNPAYDYSVHNSPQALKRVVGSSQPVPIMPVVESSLPSPVLTPYKLRTLVRSESSDTERLGEIMMVTTMVQVHESLMSKDRRDSTTSTHDSLAISVSSFKSEEMDGWKEVEEESSGGLQQPQAALSFGGGPQLSPGIATEVGSTSLATLEKEKGTRKYNLRLKKNKTAPLLNGMDISTIQSSLESPNRSISSSRYSTPTNVQTRRGMRQSGGVDRLGSGSSTASIQARNSAIGSGKSRLKKKSLSGFPDPTQASNYGEATTTLAKMERLKKY